MDTKTIYFTKRFTNGTLKGLAYIDQITFPATSETKMVKWLQDHKDKPIKSLTGSDYVVEDMSYQNYKRTS